MKNILTTAEIESENNNQGTVTIERENDIITIEFDYQTQYTTYRNEVDFEFNITAIYAYKFNFNTECEKHIPINNKNRKYLLAELPDLIKERAWEQHNDTRKNDWGVDFDYCKYPTEAEMYL